MQFITTGNRIAVENFTIGDLYTITFTNGSYINSACIGIGGSFVTFQRNEPELLFSLTMETAEDVYSIELYAGGSGENDYEALSNKPQINGHELIGDQSSTDLGLQSTISDLDTIRSGAAAGATAVQPATMETELAAKQDTISDLATIRSGAAAGATAVQPAAMATALANKQDSLSSTQLDAVNSGIDSLLVTQIGVNENNILSLLPTAYTAPTASSQYSVSIVTGGYAKIGNLCIVNIRCSVGSSIPSGINFFYGLPAPVADSSLADGTAICALNNNKGIYLAITKQGNIANTSGAAIAATDPLILSGMYLWQ